MADYVWDREGYLGAASLMRTGDVAPSETLHVETGSRGFLRYFRVPSTGQEQQVILKPTDRKTATLVMEDDTPERLAAFRQALVGDRWTNVVERG